MRDKLFVYGTLQSQERLFRHLNDHASLIGRGTIEGILLHHDIPEKDFPLLIADAKGLQRVKDLTGIISQRISGELYELDDYAVFNWLDQIEDALSLEELAEQGTLQPTFIRKQVKVDIDGQEKAWAYIANPNKEIITKIHKKLKTKVIIPEESWTEYKRKKGNNSLSAYPVKKTTFGLETELALLADNEAFGSLNFQELCDRQGYTFRYDDGIRRRYKTTAKIIGQALYYSLRNSGLGDNMLGFYYEKEPEVNDRFMIPHGFAYVDGERIFDDGTKEAIRRLYPPSIRQALKEQEKFEVRTNKTLDASDRFFEIAGFATDIYKGFATDQARYEMTRRFHILQALECIKETRFKGKFIGHFRIVGNSSHYNYMVDDRIKGSSLGELRHEVHNREDDAQERSRYTCDVAQVLARTFGPLISYISSSEKDDIEFKVRENGRLEFRNSVVHSKTQLTAAIAVYVAACRTVEKTIKDLIDTDDPIESYAKLNVDDLCNAFAYSLPEQEFEPSRLRYGYKIRKDMPYQDKVLSAPDSRISISYKGTVKEMGFDKYAKTMFRDMNFQKELRQITTEKEKEIIRRYIEGDLLTESRREQYRNMTSSKITEHNYGYENNFSGLFTNIFFKSKGEYNFDDSTHRLSFRLNQQMEQEESDLTLGKCPLEIILYKMDFQIGNWKQIDSFSRDITPHNYDKLTRSIYRLDRLKQPAWKEFYRLK